VTASAFTAVGKPLRMSGLSTPTAFVTCAEMPISCCSPVFYSPCTIIVQMKKKSSTKNPHAVALARLGAKKGGTARAAKLSAERRREIARKAAKARWRKAPKY
jgi:hypothetical protein